MRFEKGAALAAMALTAAVATTPAAAQQSSYNRLFVFGDSLVDSGNAQVLRAQTNGADPAPASLGYAGGRFSNGYNFADYLALGINGSPATASFRGGINYSVGGAQAAEVAGDASPSFIEQIGFFDASGATFDSNALVLVTLGGNDVRAQLAGLAIGATPTLTPAISAMSAGLAALYDRGARNFLVTGLPDIGQIPAVTSLGNAQLNAAGTQLSAGLNSAFASLVGNFDARPGVNAMFFDLFNYQKTIYANPFAYGLPVPLDRTTPCLIPPNPASGCEDNVYFDSIHPTTQVHLAIARGIGAQVGVAVIPEPSSWALMILGLGLAGAALRHRRRRLRVAFG